MLIFTKAVGQLLTPPGIVVVFIVFGWLARRRWRYVGAVALWAGIILLWVFSVPVTGYALLDVLEASAVALPNVEAATTRDADAIVVLGGGRDADQPQYGGDTVGSFTLERLRYAARLQRATGLPVLVSGGTVFGHRVPEAELMRETLAQDFHVSATWVEARSRNTEENALYSRAILQAAGKKKVWLVTDAWHMPRAIRAFRHAGIDAMMAPTGFTGGGDRTLLDYLPSSRGLFLSGLAMHEYLGLLWYRWHYGSEPDTGRGNHAAAVKTQTSARDSRPSIKKQQAP